MRFLHTSDWHIGKPLRNQKRDAEYVAALEEVLDIAKRAEVDAVLIAGDVFDSAVPPPEAERIVFHFFGELVGAGIPAVVIAGNHDHPRRMNAYAPVLRHLRISVLGEPVTADEGGVIRIASRDESETATIAALPWVSERKVRDFESLMAEGKHKEQYADGVASMMKHLCGAFRDDTINVLVAHVLLENASVGGPETGERPIDMSQAYVIRQAMLPEKAHYIALGHVHNPKQPKFRLANTYYSGSLVQCDFGEAGQEKGVRVVDIRKGRPASVEFAPLSSIRQLRNIGTAKAGVTLEEIKALADGAGDAYLKVFVKVDRPLPGLSDQVRELLPNAVDIVVERMDEKREDAGVEIGRMSPPELFTAYYREAHQSEPRPELMALFGELYEEVTGAAHQA